MITTLSDDEKALIKNLSARLAKKRKPHDELDRTYRGQQIVKTLGLAIPPDLRGFEFPLGWNRVAVDSVENRQDVKDLIRPGEKVDDAALREGWDANNMASQSSLNHRETLIHGHGFVSVSTNEDDAEHPLITVESSRHMLAKIDPRRRQMDACIRLYSDPWKSWAPDSGTLYLPDSTLWIEREGSGPWKLVDRDDHGLGKVPVIMFLNRPRPGDWFGESEMADIIPLVEMATRVLANLQLAQEIVATPKAILHGAKKSDFVGSDGRQRGEFEAYMDSIWALADANGKVSTLAAADLNNFVVVITMLAQQASSVSGLPMRYFGQNPANPASEGAIRADESRLVKNVERKNRDFGDAWGWVMALYERFRTGEWLDGNRVGVEWHDPGTPTFSQKSDAIQKLSGGVPILSQQGAWDELGWSPERKDRELGYFASERAAQEEPYLNAAAAKDGGTPSPLDADGPITLRSSDEV